MTLDGETVELQANLELPAELPLIAQSGAYGIGLLRSEFLFMNRETLPDEAAQTEVYRTVIEAMGGDPVTIRVLDWGGEKEIEALESEGIVPEVADAQPGARPARHPAAAARDRAVRDAARRDPARRRGRPVRVLLPMVTNVAEVRAAREIYERVARRLRRRGERLPDTLPPLGIMIETPGAALSADALALEADFFAIGTNDLAMYTLAVDRGETDVAHLYDPLHPAVLRLVQFATEAALRMRMRCLGVRRDGGQSAADAAAARARAAQLQHERVRGAAREAGGARAEHRRLRPLRPPRDGAERSGTHPGTDHGTARSRGLAHRAQRDLSMHRCSTRA